MYSREIATRMLQVAPAVCRLQGPRIDDPPLLTLILREKSIKSEGLPVISRPGPPTTSTSAGCYAISLSLSTVTSDLSQQPTLSQHTTYTQWTALKSLHMLLHLSSHLLRFSCPEVLVWTFLSTLSVVSLVGFQVCFTLVTLSLRTNKCACYDIGAHRLVI